MLDRDRRVPRLVPAVGRGADHEDVARGREAEGVMAWRWRLAVPVIVVLAGVLTRGLWLPSIGQSLVCAENVASADVLLLENFDPDYRLFERAATLQREGHSARVLVPTRTSSSDSNEANLGSR